MPECGLHGGVNHLCSSPAKRPIEASSSELVSVGLFQWRTLWES
nr:MAG TPA_asm: hypothetical protein [Caudoviricetes sp.]